VNRPRVLDVKPSGGRVGGAGERDGLNNRVQKGVQRRKKGSNAGRGAKVGQKEGQSIVLPGRGIIM